MCCRILWWLQSINQLPSTMKKLIALIAAALTMGVLSPVEARAGHRSCYRSDHSRGPANRPQIYFERGGPVVALSFGGSHYGRDHGNRGHSYGNRGHSYVSRGHGHKRHRHGHRH